jgi:UDP-N-acetylmuramoyl-tripeptide--D-alanyl-D-alanine ligase
VAIENFAKMNSSNKVLLLGAMAELGAQSLQEHQSIIDLILQYDWRNVVLVGGDFMKIHHPFQKFLDSEQAKEWFKQQNFDNSSLLIKGSRSMQMEKILE